MDSTKEQTLQSSAKELRAKEVEIKETAERQARKIINLAIQRVTSKQVAQSTSSTISVDNEAVMKQFLARQGHHLRIFEKSADVELLVNDLDNAITVNAGDPVKREIARKSLETLINGGKINTQRIENLIKRNTKSIERTIKQAGRRAIREAKVKKLHPALVNLLGRLNYRTSYGQNQRLHLIETAHVASIMAIELGADVKIPRLGGLLHDIGKALTHEVEGPHALIGSRGGQKVWHRAYCY